MEIHACFSSVVHILISVEVISKKMFLKGNHRKTIEAETLLVQ